jgi:hypothetical protein
MNRPRDPWPPPQEKGRTRETRRPGENRSGQKRQRHSNASRHPAQVERPFEIWTTKFDGSSRFYQAYDDQKIAEGVRDRLKEIGLPCEIRIAGKRAATR